MGMFDDVSLAMFCPRCQQFALWHLQTKDLECYMYHYYVLDEDWFTRNDGIGGKSFRQGLPVFPTVPYDKSAECWANQAERKEILARPSEDIADKLKYIEVHGSCPNCNCYIRGKLAIKDGYLTKPVYDIEVKEEVNATSTKKEVT